MSLRFYLSKEEITENFAVSGALFSGFGCLCSSLHIDHSVSISKGVGEHNPIKIDSFVHMDLTRV